MIEVHTFFSLKNSNGPAALQVPQPVFKPQEVHCISLRYRSWEVAPTPLCSIGQILKSLCRQFAVCNIQSYSNSLKSPATYLPSNLAIPGRLNRTKICCPFRPSGISSRHRPWVGLCCRSLWRVSTDVFVTDAESRRAACDAIDTRDVVETVGG